MASLRDIHPFVFDFGLHKQLDIYPMAYHNNNFKKSIDSNEISQYGDKFKTYQIQILNINEFFSYDLRKITS